MEINSNHTGRVAVSPSRLLPIKDETGESLGPRAYLSATGEFIRQVVLGMVDWFLPADIESSDHMRCRLIVTISAGLAIWGPIFAFLYLHRLHWMPGFIISCLCTLSVIAVPFLLRRTGSIWLAGNGLVFNLLIGVTYLSYLGGGEGAPPLNWIVALPILAVSISGRKSGLFWTAVGLLDLSIFYLMEGAGFDWPQQLTPSQKSLLQLTVLSGLLALLLSIALINESQKLQASLALAQRQADLSETTARLQAIVDYAPDAIVTFNTRGIVESFNPAAERLFLYASAEILGQPLRKLLPTPTCTQGDPGSTQVAKSLGYSGHAGQFIVGRRRDRSLVKLHVTVGQAKIKNRPSFTAIMREVTAHEPVATFKQ